VYPPPPSWQIPAHTAAGGRGSSIDDLEGSGTESRVEGRIIAILRPREPIHPCARSITCHTAQIHSNDLVNDLRLAVRLGMEGRAHAEGNARHSEKIAPHVAGEDGSRSLTIEDGNPCSRTTPSKKARATEAASCCVGKWHTTEPSPRPAADHVGCRNWHASDGGSFGCPRGRPSAPGE
jgi:hypothetical protein